MIGSCPLAQAILFARASAFLIKADKSRYFKDKYSTDITGPTGLPRLKTKDTQDGGAVMPPPDITQGLRLCISDS